MIDVRSTVSTQNSLCPRTAHTTNWESCLSSLLIRTAPNCATVSSCHLRCMRRFSSMVTASRLAGQIRVRRTLAVPDPVAPIVKPQHFEIPEKANHVFVPFASGLQHKSASQGNAARGDSKATPKKGKKHSQPDADETLKHKKVKKAKLAAD